MAQKARQQYSREATAFRPFANIYALAQQRYGDRGPHRSGNGAFNSDGHCSYYQGKDASGRSIGASSGCG